MKNKRHIIAFTGNRAEYGLLYPLLKELDNNKNIDLQLIVSGAHLDENFGNTIFEIENDGFKIAAECKIPFEMNQVSSTSKAIAHAVLSISEFLEHINPDMFLVYADRFEGFAATIAATQMSTPTAHIEGGDITEGGTLDDTVRHAMTKLSHLHFTTNEEAANRIIAMGEESWRVHNVGFSGIDLIMDDRVSSSADLSIKYNLDLTKPIVLFTMHAVSVEFTNTKQHIQACLDALKVLASDGAQIIMTYPNNDVGSHVIIQTLLTWQKQHCDKNVQIHKSLGQENYYGILSLAKDPEMRVVCVGNSSSGIKETPAFLCPTVNIGPRQSGRLRAQNVLDASCETTDILEKIKLALFDSSFRNRCRSLTNPYGTGGSSKKIAEILLNTELGPELLRKKMTLDGVKRYA